MIINNQIIDLLMFYSVQEPHFLVLANLQSIQSNKRQKKETLGFFPSIFHLHASLLAWNFNSLKKKPRKFFTFFSFRDQSSWKKG